MTINVPGYAARAATEPLAPFQFERRAPRADGVVIDIPTQEMLDFMLKGEVKSRFVIDMASLRKDQQ
jgi:D-arabinose 1-dehydrogenase-like Zn-dependent alcohol dehydrogenase